VGEEQPRVASGEEQPCGPPSVGRKKAGPAPHSNHGVAASAVRKTSRAAVDKGSRGRKEQRCGGEVGWRGVKKGVTRWWHGAAPPSSPEGRGGAHAAGGPPARLGGGGIEQSTNGGVAVDLGWGVGRMAFFFDEANCGSECRAIRRVELLN
jgi:hypothetical protein